jgi:nucleoside-diphosphate-sugar epimerase
VKTAKVLLETEKLLLAAVAERKFPAVILRVAGIYGPDRGRWVKQFLKNEARMEGDSSRFLNMIHRDDLIGCIIAALKSGRAGEIYNAADDEPVTQLHFFQWLAQALDKPLPPSEPAAVALARSGEPQENPDAARKRGATNKRVSNRKLKMELGHQFKYPNFRKGYSAELLRLDRAAS